MCIGGMQLIQFTFLEQIKGLILGSKEEHYSILRSSSSRESNNGRPTPYQLDQHSLLVAVRKSLLILFEKCIYGICVRMSERDLITVLNCFYVFANSKARKIFLNKQYSLQLEFIHIKDFITVTLSSINLLIMLFFTSTRARGVDEHDRAVS